MPNHLANASSPYLLQHKDNPVDWYPWCDEALTRSRKEDKPIFLSIGYSACHWCHVMEHESFENEDIAKYINQHFIAIKVDREERPDLDHTYMAAVQMMTGRGGWPLSVFLTPSLKPFYGGTYWPPESRFGLPGFMDVLKGVTDAWRDRRMQAEQVAEALTEQIKQREAPLREAQPLPDAAGLTKVMAQCGSQFDEQFGGFGSAPKFPHAMVLRALLRDGYRDQKTGSLHVANVTLDHMHRGGIYDHLGGGFARYSVDAEWQVPHFEKMLYDNALLTSTYVEAFQITGRIDFRHVVEETLDYLLRDMQLPDGGFASSEDADSEGVEGKFYVWSLKEIEEILGDDAKQFSEIYGVTATGNFEGENILHLSESLPETAKRQNQDPFEFHESMSDLRKKLFDVREKRIRPGKDDKVITGWNALAIEAFSKAGAALQSDRYINAAKQAANFLKQELVDDQGRLLHTWRVGKASIPAFADDYAALIDACISLYEATFDESWVTWAWELAEQLETLFQDKANGGFFLTGSDQPITLVRAKPVTDSSTPSANNMAATALIRLGTLCAAPRWIELASEAIPLALPYLEAAPLAVGQAMLAIDWLVGPTHEWVFPYAPDAAPVAEVLKDLHQLFMPNTVVLCGDPSAPRKDESPLKLIFTGKQAGEELTLYVCERGICREPMSGLSAVKKMMQPYQVEISNP